MSEIHVEPVGAPSLESARSVLLSIIRDKQGEYPKGVRSTQVGAEFSKRTGVPFEPYINAAVLVEGIDVPSTHRKMRPFIERYCKDIIEYVPDTSGNGFVRELKADSGTAGGPVPGSDAPIPRYRKSVWLAFVRPLPPGLKRYINLGDRAGFTDIAAKDTPEQGWLEVEREFIAAIPPDKPIDATLVQAGLSAWMTRHNVEVAKLLEPDLVSGRKASVADLIRIIDALPDPIASEWKIPAVVIKHLSK